MKKHAMAIRIFKNVSVETFHQNKNKNVIALVSQVNREGRSLQGKR